jgi:sRNA-binding regulator protein Hfq
MLPETFWAKPADATTRRRKNRVKIFFMNGL